MARKVFALAGLVVGVAAFAYAAQDGIVLKRTVEQGQTLLYDFNATSSVQGMDVNISGTLRETVRSVEADGSFEVESVNEGFRVSVMGEEIPLPDASTITKFGANGEILDIRGDEVTAETAAQARLNAFIFPTDPVEAGDSWTREDDNVEMTYTFVGSESYGGFETHKIEWRGRDNSSSPAAEVSGTMWLDQSDGSMVRVEFEWRNMQQMGFSVDARGTISRR